MPERMRAAEAVPRAEDKGRHLGAAGCLLGASARVSPQSFDERMPFILRWQAVVCKGLGVAHAPILYAARAKGERNGGKKLPPVFLP